MLVDNFDPLALQLFQGGLNVGDAVPDVMHALAVAIEELPDGGVGTKRPQELDVRRSDPEQNFIDPLLLDPLTMDRLDAALCLVQAAWAATSLIVSNPSA